MDNKIINGIIYKVTGPSGKIYIGQTIRSFKERKRKHLYAASHALHKDYNLKFYNALRKHGFENFKWEIVMENIPSNKHLDMWERLFIHLECSIVNGYNISQRW